ncbi:hypothetical protein [Polaromonas jejuensis]|uniref:Phage holin n=1 Tax=Polaromonas jejuensis TaxID=457502 RepID=A0ABW0QI58_9BURK|nr:hypothetical protein [Polaromonas jejuensis]
MPEPTSTAAATLVAAAAAVPALTAFGVPLGLRPDLLVAGFSGGIVAIILLNSVPSTGDTWRELVRTTLRRMAVAVASSLTAGYLAPLALLLASLPESLLLGSAFAVGGGAQHVLMFFIQRFAGKSAAAGGPVA